jgi:hypothetical protein
MPNKDRRERAQMPLRNPLNDDVPITVVPDNQMPQYGAEVPARSTNKVLEGLLSMIRTHQKPVTIPFAAGTPTEARRQFDTGQEFSREKFDWEKDLTERQFAADQAYKNAQLTLSRLGASGSGGGDTLEDPAIDPKLWTDAAKIARELWNESEDYVWVNKQTGETIKEENGIKPPGISEYDINWERQGIPRTPFDSLDEYEKGKRIYEVYTSNTLLPGFVGIDPTIPPSSMPDPGSLEYYRELAMQARREGYHNNDIIKWLIEKYNMPPEIAGKIGLSIPGR